MLKDLKLLSVMKHFDGILKGFLLVLAMACGTVTYAVTLPTTSYTPSYQTSGADPTYSSDYYGSPTFTSSKFSILGDYSSWGTACEAGTASFADCSSCCSDKLSQVCPDPTQCDPEYIALYTECANDCGRSLPLGSGLCMLLMALCYGGARVATSNISKGK